MRIALINQPFDKVRPPVQSSLGIWTYEVARQLASEHEVAIYLPGGRFRCGVVREKGVEYRYVPMACDRLLEGVLERAASLGLLGGKSQPRFGSDGYHHAFAKAIARDLRKTPCDVVHVLNFSQFVPVLRRGCPTARIGLHMQCDWLTQLNPNMVAPRLAQADAILACSGHVSQEMREAYPQFAERCGVLYNGVDVQGFSPQNGQAPSPPSADRTLRIVFVGRVSPEKGIHVLLDAFGQVHQRFPEAALEIIGPREAVPFEFVVAVSKDPRVKALAQYYDSDYQSHLDSQLAGPLKDRVTFSGNLPYAELVERYRHADVFVFPSVWHEPFGMPNVEAMACGVPVVATRSGGIPELVADGETGLLVERGDAMGLAKALMDLLGDPARRAAMGRAGRQRAEQLFSWKRIAAQLLERYAACDRVRT